MTVIREYFTDFSSGLLSSSLDGRVDLPQYKKGARVLRNWWPKLAGGLERRPGSLYLSDLTADPIRYEPWVFSETQEYIAVFTFSQLRIYDPDTGALVSNVPNVAAFADWQGDQIKELKVTAVGDTMLVFHKDLAALKVVRESASSFVASAFSWETDTRGLEQTPFWKFNTPASTLQPTGTTGSIQLTCSEDVFVAKHINTVFRYRGKQTRITGIIDSKKATATCLEDLDRSARLIFTFGQDNGNDFEIGEIVVGRDTGIKAIVVTKNPNAIEVSSIAGDFGSSESNEQVEGLDSGNIATIVGRLSIVPLPDADWDEQAFSAARGWPAVGEFHAQRLWLGGSSSLPAHIFGSKVAAYFNFDVGEGFPNDSIQALISDSQVNSIIDLVSNEHLLVFTDHAEFYAPQTENRPLVPETFNLLKQSQYGCSKQVRPQNMGANTLYIQRDGNAIREMQWNDRRKKYVSPPISVLADEYTRGIIDIAVLDGGYEREETIAFFINGSNQIVYYHSNDDEGIRGWGIWDSSQLSPEYVTLVVVNNKLFAGVRRDIGDEAPPVVMERFEFSATLDCAIELTGAAASSWPAAFMTLHSRNVSVVSNTVSGSVRSPEYYGGDFTLNVSGDLDMGGVSLQNITVGLKFDQQGEPMPIEVQLPNGWSIGLPKRIVSSDVLLRSSLAFQQNGQSIHLRQVTDDPSSAPAAVTKKFKFYGLGWAERQTVEFVNTVPLPCEVTALSCEVEV